MRLCASRGDRVSVICVTDGEAARPEIQDLPQSVWRKCGPPVNTLSVTERPSSALGSLTEKSQAARAHLLRGLEARLPANVTLIAPYEHDGHTDHDAVGRVCIELAAKHCLPLARYPIWAWHQLTPDLLSDEHAVQVALDEKSQAAKSAAIECYRSQMEDRPGGAVVPEHVIAYFRRNCEVYLL